MLSSYECPALFKIQNLCIVIFKESVIVSIGLTFNFTKVELRKKMYCN